MRIGIDIDGVLTDVEQWQLDFGSKFFYEQFQKEIMKPQEYEIQEIFGVNKKEDDKFWKEYFLEYSMNVEMRKFASEVIERLKKEKNEIYIITARGSFLLDNKEYGIKLYDENKRIVTNWLEKNKIKYDKLIFSKEDKLETCLKYNIDIMIEDKADNINLISTKIPVICFHANYNNECCGKSIIRCYSWYDIYAKIQKFKKE